MRGGASGLRHVVLASMLLGCGCNSVFGVTPPPPLDVITGSDRDDDGVLDDVDNCIDVSNAGQEDLDADDVGDACDPCSAFPPSTVADDDLDTARDHVDRCPGTPGIPDMDSDQDGIGNDCDPRPSDPSDARRCWMDLTDPALAFASWHVIGTNDPWTKGASSIAKRSPTETPGFIRTTFSGLFETPTGFAVQTRVTLDFEGADSEVGIGVAATATSPGRRCVYRRSAGVGSLALVLPDGPTDVNRPAGGTTITLTLAVLKGPTTTTIECTARPDGGGPTSSVNRGTVEAPQGELAISLISEGAMATFHDVVTYDVP